MKKDNLDSTIVSKKISKIRWCRESYAEADSFITGSWCETLNDVTYWKFKTNEEGAPYPSSITTFPINGDVTELKTINTDFFVVSSSNGFLKILKLDESPYATINEVISYDELHKFSDSESAPCTGFSIFEQDIVTIGEDSRINLLIAQEKTPLRTISEADSCTLTCVDFLKHNEIITGNSRGHMKVWDLRNNQDNQPATTFMMSGKYKTEATHVVHHPTQRHTVVAGGGDGSLTVWDLRQDTFPISQLNAHSKAVTEVLFHPDRPDNLFTCSVSGEVWHWNNSQQKINLDGNDAHWLNTVKGKVHVTSLCVPMHKPINTLDVDRSTLLFGCDNESLCVVRDLDV